MLVGGEFYTVCWMEFDDYEGPSDMLHKEGNPIAEGDIVTLRANL